MRRVHSWERVVSLRGGLPAGNGLRRGVSGCSFAKRVMGCSFWGKVVSEQDGHGGVVSEQDDHGGVVSEQDDHGGVVSEVSSVRRVVCGGNCLLGEWV